MTFEARSLGRLLGTALTGALILAGPAPESAWAQASPCTTYVKAFKNNSRTDGKICPGDSLQYTLCVRSQTSSAPPGLFFETFLPQTCFASFNWTIAPPGSDTSCSVQPIFRTRRGVACASDFPVPAGGEVCGVIEATLGSPLADLTNCTISLFVTWDLDGCSSSDTRQVSCAPPGTPDTRATKVIEGVDPTLNDRCMVSTVDEGTTIVYRLAAQNVSADGDDTNVTLIDDVPAGLTNLQLLTPSCTLCGAGCPACFDPTQGPNGRLTVNVGSLPRSSSYEVRFSMDVPRTCGSGTWFANNQARVSSDSILANVPAGFRLSDNLDGDPTAPEPTCSGPIRRTGTTSGTVVKSVDRTVAAPGDTVHFTITFDGTASACPLSGTMRDDLPAGINLVPTSVVFPPGWAVSSAGPPGGINGAGYVQVDMASINAGEAPTVEFDAVIDSTGACLQPEVNRANWSLDSGSGTAVAPAITVTSSTPDDIAVTKTASAPTAVKDDVITYTIRIENLSACPISGGVLDDPIPAGMVLDQTSITASFAGPTNVSTATAVRFNGINLTTTAPNNVLTITYDVTVDGTVGGDIVNTATVTFPTASDAGQASVNVQGGPLPCTTPPAEVHNLYARNASPDVVLTWDSVLNAATYNLYQVLNAQKAKIPSANKAASDPDIVALAACQAVPDANRTCTDTGVIGPSTPPLLFYQVRGVCSDGVSEGQSHPF